MVAMGEEDDSESPVKSPVKDCTTALEEVDVSDLPADLRMDEYDDAVVDANILGGSEMIGTSLGADGVPVEDLEVMGVEGEEEEEEMEEREMVAPAKRAARRSQPVERAATAAARREAAPSRRPTVAVAAAAATPTSRCRRSSSSSSSSMGSPSSRSTRR